MRQRAKRIFHGVSAALFLGVLGISILILVAALAHTARAPHYVEWEVPKKGHWAVTIAPGDTLWNLAKKYYPHVDPRKATAAIQKLNGLPDAVIYPGQTIALPVLDRQFAAQMAVVGDRY